MGTPWMWVQPARVSHQPRPKLMIQCRSFIGSFIRSLSLSLLFASCCHYSGTCIGRPGRSGTYTATPSTPSTYSSDHMGQQFVWMMTDYIQQLSACSKVHLQDMLGRLARKYPFCWAACGAWVQQPQYYLSREFLNKNFAKFSTALHPCPHQHPPYCYKVWGPKQYGRVGG